MRNHTTGAAGNVHATESDSRGHSRSDGYFESQEYRGADAEPWAQRWGDHYGELVRYADFLLGDSHAAEDVVQETAIRLWQHPEVLDDGLPLRGWLRTVARNIIVDRTRRQRARPAEVTIPDGLDPECLPERDRIDRADGLDTVVTALQGLTPAHRAAVFEVYVRDRPVADAAASLDVPVGTIKSRCHHALIQLRADSGAATIRALDCA
jgi:RNA polymerase sigma-70 factor, ECF subfamily